MKYFVIDGFHHGLILPLVMEGVSQLPIFDNAYDIDVESDIESKKPLDQIIGLLRRKYSIVYRV